MRELINILFAVILASVIFTGTMVVMGYIYQNHSFNLFKENKSENCKGD